MKFDVKRLCSIDFCWNNKMILLEINVSCVAESSPDDPSDFIEDSMMHGRVDNILRVFSVKYFGLKFIITSFSDFLSDGWQKRPFNSFSRNISKKSKAMQKRRDQKNSVKWNWNFVLVTCEWKEWTKIQRIVGSWISCHVFFTWTYSEVFVDFETNSSRTWHLTFSISLIIRDTHDILDYWDTVPKNTITHDWYASKDM